MGLQLNEDEEAVPQDSGEVHYQEQRIEQVLVF